MSPCVYREGDAITVWCDRATMRALLQTLDLAGRGAEGNGPRMTFTLQQGRRTREQFEAAVLEMTWRLAMVLQVLAGRGAA